MNLLRSILALLFAGCSLAFAETAADSLKPTGSAAVSPAQIETAKKSGQNSGRESGKNLDESSEKGKGGLLAGLYPVESDEAIVKGNFLAGTTLFLLQGNTDKETLNILIGDLYKADGYTFTVKGFGAYFVRDAMALGARAGYSRTKLDIDYSILEDLADISEHREYLSNGFFVQPFLKNYLKVIDSKNVYFFNETSVSVEYSYGISQSDDGEDLSKSRTRGWTFEFGINPGVSIMVLDRFAFETSVGLLGLSSTVMEIEENGEKRSEFTYSIVNFTINLLALNFSLVYFF